MRKWLAGWSGQISHWFARLADRLWPPYPRRFAVGGEVQGSGPASEDSIPVWLGEPYVYGADQPPQFMAALKNHLEGQEWRRLCPSCGAHLIDYNGELWHALRGVAGVTGLSRACIGMP
ncbi:hypothetical protein [Nocardia asiatica]|uniref:hypothetical protein n=1 Tax=Nocardia asiatica TaxID=209252 RepID=UPI0024578BB1|nr:hypothetical protein [Nocardia asiatica]